MRKKRYAYIFDFDGVLVRTMEAHFQCYKQALAEFGVPIDRKQFFHQAGMTGQEQIRYFVERAGVPVKIEEVYQRKRAIWEKSSRAVTAIDCNVAFLRMLCAARRLGISPQNCIVVEDSDVGIDAAKSAKMKAIRFYDNEGD